MVAPPVTSHNSSSLHTADTLGIGFSGSGFLIFYFTGVSGATQTMSDLAKSCAADLHSTK
jgi:hypothetical protein